MATVITWTVSADGATWVEPFTLGMENLLLTLRRNGIDTLTWQVVTSYDGDPAWAHASTIYLRQTVTTDGVPAHVVRFIGRVEGIPRDGASGQEGIGYEAVGIWWWLDRVTFSQSWLTFNAADGTTYSVPTPRVILCQAPDGATQSMGAMITAAIDWAITRGVPCQRGTVDVLVPMPLDEQTNIKCADAIRAAMRLMPDLSCWVDYNTTKTVGGVTTYVPTIHCRQAANLDAASIVLPAATANTIKLLPRYDLQVPGIRIVFESTFTADGRQNPCISIDTAGSVNDPLCIDLLYDLAGGKAEYVKQDLEVADYPEDPADRTFWRSIFSWLENIDDADLVITDVSSDGTKALPGYLIKGAIHEWMGVDHEEETWTATISYVRRDAATNAVEKAENKPVTATLISVDAEATEPGTPRTYRRLSAWDSGETVPTGVAAAIYASWSRLHWDGRLHLEEEEVTFQAGPRHVVNLTGGRAEWSTMADLVQEAAYSLDRGTTDLTLGSGGRWEADSLVALYRAAGNRRFAWHANLRDDPSSAASEIEGPKVVAQKVANDGDPGEAMLSRWHGTDSGSRVHAAIIDPSAIAFAAPADAAAKTLQLREVRLLEKQVDGAYKAKLAQVLCSPLYDNAGGDVVGGINIASPAEGDMIRYARGAWTKVTPVQVTFQTAWKLDKANHKFQVKTRIGYVVAPGAESGWTDIADADGGVLDVGVTP